MRIALTGRLAMRRDEIVVKLLAKGDEIVPRVTPQTDLLVVDNPQMPPNTRKYRDAVKYRVNVVSFNDLERYLNGAIYSYELWARGTPAGQPWPTPVETPCENVHGNQNKVSLAKLLTQTVDSGTETNCVCTF